MTTRFRGIALAMAFAFSTAAVAGCKPLYGGKAQALKGPPKKKKPPEPDAAAIPYNEDCKTAFFEDGSKHRRNPGGARSKIGQGDASLSSAESSTDKGAQASLTIEAINSYKKALVDDNYSAEATYKLAAAYARVRKKKCAVDLLTRLAALQKHPDYEAEAKRMVQAASQDSVFQGFRKDADGALGI